MYREILIKRVQSIVRDIRILSKVGENMDVMDIPLILKNYENVSAEAARRAEWVAIRLRHLVYALPFTPKRDYLPRPPTPWGLKSNSARGCMRSPCLA